MSGNLGPINEAAKGNCYEAAGQLIQKYADWKLCHGIVKQSGVDKEVRMGHAWIEKKINGVWFVKDGLYPEALVLRAYYYHVGHVKMESVVRYDQQAAIEKMLETKNYGPWDAIVAAAAHNISKGDS